MPTPTRSSLTAATQPCRGLGFLLFLLVLLRRGDDLLGLIARDFLVLLYR